MVIDQRHGDAGAEAVMVRVEKATIAASAAQME
jgi:hypothetical protein